MGPVCQTTSLDGNCCMQVELLDRGYVRAIIIVGEIFHRGKKDAIASHKAEATTLLNDFVIHNKSITKHPTIGLQAKDAKIVSTDTGGTVSRDAGNTNCDCDRSATYHNNWLTKRDFQRKNHIIINNRNVPKIINFALGLLGRFFRSR